MIINTRMEPPRREQEDDQWLGVYRVAGRRAYRGHQPGTVFQARLDRAAEQRAIQRGDILLLDRIIPALQPGSYRFPPGWLPADNPPIPRRRKAPLT